LRLETGDLRVGGMERKAEGCKVNGAGFRAKRAKGSVKELRLRVEVKGGNKDG
jgi:hypothetical protein